MSSHVLISQRHFFYYLKLMQYQLPFRPNETTIHSIPLKSDSLRTSLSSSISFVTSFPSNCESSSLLGLMAVGLADDFRTVSRGAPEQSKTTATPSSEASWISFS